MVKTLADLRAALDKIQAVHEESWTKDNFNVELTRALTILENARMEWNAARLKFNVLSAPSANSPISEATAPGGPASLFGTYSFGEMCRLGFALTWPVAVAVVGVAVLLLVMLRR